MKMQRLFIDNLNFSSLIHVLMSCLLKGKLRIRIYYFASSSSAKAVVRRLGKIIPVSAEEASYSASQVIGNDSSSWCRITQEELLEICNKICDSELNRHELVRRMGLKYGHSRIILYLKKSIARDIETALRHIRVVEWYGNNWKHDPSVKSLFFIEGTPWQPCLAAYAKQSGIQLRQYRRIGGSRRQFATGILEKIAGRLNLRRSRRPVPEKREIQKIQSQSETPARIAVSFIGKSLTLDPTKNSELFMLPYVKAQPGKVLLYFWREDNPLTEEKRQWLERTGIQYAVINAGASVCEDVPVWRFQPDSEAGALYKEFLRALLSPSIILSRPELNIWLIKIFISFIGQYSYWRAFYRTFHVKTHLTHTDWNQGSIAAEMALSDLGGTSISYQVSAGMLFSTIAMAGAVDVHFVFAPNAAHIKLQSGSCISQYVAVGYNYDNSFQPVREKAINLRKHLQDNGVRFIICFFDENSVSDKRSLWVHEKMAEDYIFLLKKLFEDSTLGMIFKPKKPGTLRNRLGTAAQLLDSALKTGRCFIFEGREGELVTDALPNEGSQAADVAIGILHGLTAAAESMLAGTPTLLIDRFYIRHHPYYKWGRDRVVFDDWDRLFSVLTEYRRDRNSVPGFGDWTPVLDQIDPFRDGRAAERMGKYIRWLADGLNMGLPKEEILNNARQRYAAKWGSCMVIAPEISIH